MLRRAWAATAALTVALLVLLAPAAKAGDGSPTELPEPTASPEDVRQQADEILDQRQFQRPEPNPIQRAEQWVDEQMGNLFNELVSGDAGSLVGWLVLIVALVALLFFLRRLGRSVQADPRTETEVSVERVRTADEWREDAEAHERAGAWKAALRSRFRALVADLVDLGHVDDVPGRTAGEYRAEVAEQIPSAADAFAEATGLFEDAWYGDRETGPEENRRFRALSDQVVTEGRRRELVGAPA